MDFFFIAVTALVASIVNSVAGGGTFLTFPVLCYAELGNLPQTVANMTSTIGLWPGSAASVLAARQDFRKIPTGMLITYSLISIFGGAIGSVLLITTPEQSFKTLIPWLLLFATVVFMFSRPIARMASRKHDQRGFGWVAFVAFVQFFIAIYGGYFGAGIGVLMLAGLSCSGLTDIRQMNALKVLLATIINGVATAIFVLTGLYGARLGINRQLDIQWTYVGTMAIASIIGGFAGMEIARVIKRGGLRFLVILIGFILTGVYFAENYFGAFDDEPQRNTTPHSAQSRPSVID